MKEIYKETISVEAMNRIGEELEKNPEFVLTKKNICDFYYCKDTIKLLEELNIEYKLILIKPKTEIIGKKIVTHSMELNILISDEDYIRNKDYFFTSNGKDEKVEYEDYDTATKIAYKFGTIILSIMFGGFGVLVLVF